MGSVDVRIIQVHLWNGGSKVQEFKDLDWTPGHLNEVLVLKTPQKFTNGVGVSVNIGAGVENMNHRFTVANVCALYAPTPGK
jgi:hypothetical protein